MGATISNISSVPYYVLGLSEILSGIEQETFEMPDECPTLTTVDTPLTESSMALVPEIEQQDTFSVLSPAKMGERLPIIVEEHEINPALLDEPTEEKERYFDPESCEEECECDLNSQIYELEGDSREEVDEDGEEDFESPASPNTQRELADQAAAAMDAEPDMEPQVSLCELLEDRFTELEALRRALKVQK
ncbi:hypothetical protein P152DRAFT_477935 [Eremomyces bilateralis CBS 781.70]|uniref:Uncharacterized protein n=1 Tax=Eremomyces bilateralis CBS 781.70 TaxID=1392243 RepID=A0A6G1GFI6_9PEZI|nr:uncharacterized protein P152DRAFT_477935 [Eremomyces bilateralis CBS 781.70]KAF1816847.1 hypothetical protein P152DRAFT_477935 [Eremomyces bilateralis CBS 781.70]